MIERRAIDALEYGKIIDNIAGRCVTPYGQPKVRALTPLDDRERLVELRGQIAEQIELQLHDGGSPVVAVPDIRPHLTHCLVPGRALGPESLLDIAEFVRGIVAVHRTPKEIRVKYPRFDEHLDHLIAHWDIVREIDRAIDEEAEVRDNASPTLRKLRAEKRAARQSIVDRLERIIQKRDLDPTRADDLITLRNDRFVIPMPESDPAVRDGVIQDRSGSGATFFVEPNVVVELNNRLRRIGIEESREIERILLGLTDMVRAVMQEFFDNVELVGNLDMQGAVARFADSLDATLPILADSPKITLHTARHPLLMLQALKQPENDRPEVVPLSLEIDDDQSTLVVTGPNTGGKTVALKTVGLLTLMAQTGLPIPAEDTSAIGIFDRIFVDIGDEQSIEASLSTFSSHVVRIVDAVTNADDRSLVLLDELGAGTDPREGAALGEAIILAMTERAARVMVTTHHGALKTLAQQHSRIANASVAFDLKTLSPTYRFVAGLPGASYAIEIAKRLGMSDDVTRRAHDLLGKQEHNLAALLSELEQRLDNVSKLEDEAAARSEAATALEDLFRVKLERLEKTAREQKSQAAAEAEQIVAETRREMERLVRDIRESQAEKATIKQSHRRLKEVARKVEKQTAQPKTVPAPATTQDPPAVGDRVWIESFKQEGEVVAVLEGQHKLKVQLGNFLYTVDTQLARRLAGQAQSIDSTSSSPSSPRPATPVGRMPTADVGNELKLIGQAVDEAKSQLDRYLDDAPICGWKEVRIVHGKGTGALRSAVAEFLNGDSRVTSFRLGNWDEGGDGVTFATLRTD